MVLISAPFPILSPDIVSLYHTTDPLFNLPVLVYHGPSTTTNTTLNSARIQVHVFSPAGFHSYPRITVSPNSPLYAAVRHLPQEQQGDEVCRGLAIGLLKYFGDLSEVVKTKLAAAATPAHGRHGGSNPAMFDEMHAGDLASRMTKVINAADVTRDLQAAYQERSLPCIDLDVLLPARSIRCDPLEPSSPSEHDIITEDDKSLHRYGRYASLVRLFGQPTFLPTSRLRRAPSKPTTLNRSKSLSKSQKELLRREMCELVDTEERYVEKLQILVTDIANSFRNSARTQYPASSTLASESLQTLFPPSLDEILSVNSRFLEELRRVLDATDEGAMAEIEADTTRDVNSFPIKKQSRGVDTVGTVAISKVLLAWFPLFATSYTDYMRASGGFSDKLSGLCRYPESPLAQKLRSFGEQRLRSLLIEPVQRLPRYTLFIDSITNNLPAAHAALKPLLKARDIITNICALDADSADHSQTVNRLRTLIGAWPAAFEPRGRLISAVDVLELVPPFQLDLTASTAPAGILLLFTDHLVMISKSAESKMSARGIMGEVDRPSTGDIAVSLAEATSGRQTSRGLLFHEALSLDAVRLDESYASRMIWVRVAPQFSTVTNLMTYSSPTAADIRAYRLYGAYEAKAAKWLEEAAKARIEARYSEEERETDNWEMRSVTNVDSALTVYAAVFESTNGQPVRGRGIPSLVQVVIDDPGHDRSVVAGKHGAEIVLSVSRVGDDVYRLGTDVINGHFMVEHVAGDDLGTVLFRRLVDSLYQQHLPRNAALTSSILTMNELVLRSLSIHGEGESSRPRTFRPTSPVKMLSNFLSGQPLKENHSPTKHRHPTLGYVPKISALARNPSRPELRRPVTEEANMSMIAIVTSEEPKPMVGSLISLEETFQTYVRAIHARRGNVVGRVIRARSMADELTVNALYNSLLEDPSRDYLAAEAPVDVLFAAFEKFLKLAWDDKMGPIVKADFLRALLSKSDALRPAEFADYFQASLGDFAPQNRRSFAATLKLLANLLDASGNDGDRGILTATFTEILLTRGDPHEFISLFDRLVDDYERLFGERPQVGANGQVTPVVASSSSSRNARSTHTGSISSNASSLKKRFGFPGLTRADSKIETAESGVGSIWRSFGRGTARSPGDSAPSSVSKASSLLRSRSTDTDSRTKTPERRPVSQDRPISLGAVAFESPKRPNSSHVRTPTGPMVLTGSPLTGRSPGGAQLCRKKRRSSLSDLKQLQEATAALTIASSSSVRKPLLPPTAGARYDPPRTPSPTKYRPPYPVTEPTQKGSPRQQEDKSPSMIMPRGTLAERPFNIPSNDDAVIILQNRPSKKTPSSTIPRSALPLYDRGGSPKRDHTSKISPTPSPTKKISINTTQANSSQKLRMQSPQKLRERLEAEKKSLRTLDTSLHTDIQAITRDLSVLSLPSRSPTKSTTTTEPTLQSLQNQLRHLTTTTSPQLSILKSTITALQSGLATTVATLERRIQKLDHLNKEANAENEALYERFNDELSKLARAAARKRRPTTAAVPRVETTRPTEAVEEMLLQLLADKEAELKKLRAERAASWKRDIMHEVVPVQNIPPEHKIV